VRDALDVTNEGLEFLLASHLDVLDTAARHHASAKGLDDRIAIAWIYALVSHR